MVQAMGEHGFEYRYCYLLLVIAAADGVLSEKEIQTIVPFMNVVLERSKPGTDVKEFVINCLDALKDGPNSKFLDETVEIFGKYLSKEHLNSLVEGFEVCVSSDGLAEKESKTIDYVKKQWGLLAE